jgi:hypothetical protein
MLSMILASIATVFRSRHALALENLASVGNQQSCNGMRRGHA